MENGRVYWSNWSGLGDVTAAKYKDTGASKLAINSIGVQLILLQNLQMPKEVDLIYNNIQIMVNSKKRLPIILVD